MLLVTAHAEVAAVAIPCDPVSPAQCRDPVLYLSVAWLGSTSDNTAAPTMVRLTLSAADMTVCFDPSDSTACCRHLSTSSTLAATQLLATAQQLTAGSQHNPHSAVSCLQQHSSSQLDHSTTLTLQSGACCRHLSTSSTLAATQLLATAQQLTAGSQHNPHSAVRCLLQALVYSSNLQPKLQCVLVPGMLVIHSPVICFRCD